MRICVCGAVLIVSAIVIILNRPSSKTGLGMPTTEPAVRRVAKPSRFEFKAPPLAGGVGAIERATVTTSKFHRIFAGEENASKLAREAVGAFVSANQTNAHSLIAAYQITRDPEYLKLAAANFPNDPEVLFSVVSHDIFPQEKGVWLERLKAAAPDNSAANYLSARELFKQGKPQEALQELYEASGKSRFADYLPNRLQTLEEAYLGAGTSPAEAKALALANVLLPHTSELRQLSKNIGSLQQQYIADGDTTSAARLAEIGHVLGQQFSAGGGAGCLLNQLVGTVIEDESLARLPQDQAYDFLGMTAAERRAQLDSQKKSIRSASQTVDRWLLAATDAEVISYVDRAKIYGESAAISWLTTRVRP